MEDFFLPVLSHFQNENFWTASAGALCYRVTPREEGLAAEVWEGPWRYEDSRVEETRTFPLSDEGLEELRRWLTDWRDAIGQRPRPGLEESIRRRDAVRAERARLAGQAEGTA